MKKAIQLALVLACVSAAAQVIQLPTSPVQTACSAASQVTLTGILQTANGLPIANSTITLKPSNVAYIAGCGVQVPAAIACATSSDGTVVGLGNPLQPPVVTANYAISALSGGTYYIRQSWYDAGNHETLVGPEVRVQLSAAGS